ncbi:MAG: heparan-alpha-glucosaminide N-acetyltransferase domain-containing protein [Acidobacteriia bacterium]|nr:heparan-alpha-glucosaminide N-acetyltransferase domain-containing protein [Terriglobia bacterium]
MPAAGDKPTSRIESIDIVRGAVMVLMAIDHVRVYSGIPAGDPTAGIFFTRWVTHFCAPAFAFLAGTGAYLYGRKLADARALARYLVTRGLLLVLLELTVIRLSWTFNFNYGHFVLAGVIWMLGWSMVLLAGLVRLPAKAIGTIGLGIIFLQQIFAFPPRLLPQQVRDLVGWIWEFVYPAGAKSWSGINILYVLVPWIGVMAAGYGFGAIFTREPVERRRLCLRIGLSATALFLVAGVLTVLLSPAPVHAPPALFRLLNQQKYPASQLFLLMTLGPTIALLPLAERARGWLAGALATFGRVPMFYYLLHIPAIHIAALFVTLLREGSVHPEWYATAPYTFLPPEHRWGLPLLYVVWVMVVAILYFPCRWFAAMKARRREGWLRYI